jgi:hypothetical protein
MALCRQPKNESMPHCTPPHDQRQRRCPRLGHIVNFGYCRIGGENQQPCFKVFDCWWEQFDVVGFFQQRLPAEAFDNLRCASPPNKVASLVELIQQARNRTRNNG